MTFAEYLKARKSYTEAGLALRAAIRGMPAEVQTVQAVRVWLYEQRASLIAVEALRLAGHSYAHVLRERRKQAAAENKAAPAKPR